MQLPPTILSINKHEKKKKENKKDKNDKDAKNTTRTIVIQNDEKHNSPSEHHASDSASGSCASDSEGSEEDHKRERIKPNKPAGIRPPRSLETTLFDRLEKMYGASIKRMLDVQYR
jgi:DNA polymerase alpha-associated DNA helicase A